MNVEPMLGTKRLTRLLVEQYMALPLGSGRSKLGKTREQASPRFRVGSRPATSVPPPAQAGKFYSMRNLTDTGQNGCNGLLASSEMGVS
jgi:hypothetical protein